MFAPVLELVGYTLGALETLVCCITDTFDFNVFDFSSNIFSLKFYIDIVVLLIPPFHGMVARHNFSDNRNPNTSQKMV